MENSVNESKAPQVMSRLADALAMIVKIVLGVVAAVVVLLVMVAVAINSYQTSAAFESEKQLMQEKYVEAGYAACTVQLKKFGSDALDGYMSASDLENYESGAAEKVTLYSIVEDRKNLGHALKSCKVIKTSDIARVLTQGDQSED